MSGKNRLVKTVFQYGKPVLLNPYTYKKAAAAASEMLDKYQAQSRDTTPKMSGKLGELEQKARQNLSGPYKTQKVKDKLDQVAGKPQAPQSPRRESANDVTARLRQIQQLHDEGVLSEQEYIQAKRNILGRL